MLSKIDSLHMSLTSALYDKRTTYTKNTCVLCGKKINHDRGYKHTLSGVRANIDLITCSPLTIKEIVNKVFEKDFFITFEARFRCLYKESFPTSLEIIFESPTSSIAFYIPITCNMEEDAKNLIDSILSLNKPICFVSKYMQPEIAFMDTPEVKLFFKIETGGIRARYLVPNSKVREWLISINMPTHLTQKLVNRNPASEDVIDNTFHVTPVLVMAGSKMKNKHLVNIRNTEKAICIGTVPARKYFDHFDNSDNPDRLRLKSMVSKINTIQYNTCDKDLRYIAWYVYSVLSIPL